MNSGSPKTTRAHERAAGLTRSRAFALALLLPWTAAGETYVVDGMNPAASDVNPGSRERPLKTVSAAADKAVAGDTVLVRPGIYRECVVLRKSGEPGKPIVFKSEQPRKAVLCGSDVIDTWRETEPGVWEADVTPTPQAKTPTPYVEHGGEWVYLDGAPMRWGDAKHLLPPNAFHIDKAAGKIYVAAPEGRDIPCHRVEYACRAGLVAPDKPLNDIQVVGFTFVHNAGGRDGPAALSAKGSRWLIEDNHILWSSFKSLMTVACGDSVLRNNIVEWAGNKAVGGLLCTRLRVEGNRFLTSNWRMIDPSWAGGGSKWLFCSDSIVRGNEFAHNHGSGLWFDSMNTGNFYEDNICHDNTVWGLFTEISWGEGIIGNICYNNGQGLVVAESSACSVRRNIVFNNEVGVRMRGDHRRKPQGGDARAMMDECMKVPGLSDVRARQIVDQALIYWTASGAALESNNVLWENIVFDNGVTYYEHRDYSRAAATDPFSGNYSDCNIFYSGNERESFTHNSGAYAGFEGWRKVSGRDAHSLFMDPRAAGAKLPGWAAEKRALWDLKMRPFSEIADMNLGLVPSPMAAAAVGRVLRASSVAALRPLDSMVKALRYEHDGISSVAVWTTSVEDRRPVLLRIDVEDVEVEDGYGFSSRRKLTGGTIEIAANFAPTYLHGVKGGVAFLPVTTLAVKGFNLPGRAIPVVVTLVNDGTVPAPSTVTFLPGAGYRCEPRGYQGVVEAGRVVEVKAELRGVDSSAAGRSILRMESVVGDRRFFWVASFTVGEGGGNILHLGDAPAVEQTFETLKRAGEAAVLGAISGKEQVANGDPEAWEGPADLSAVMYAAWAKDALCVAFDVVDDSLIPSGASLPFDFDSIEFFIDGRSPEMQWQTDHTEGVYQIGVSPSRDGAADTVKILAKTRLNGLETWSAKTAAGYAIAMRIPLTAANFPAMGWASGRTVKLSILVNDKDAPAKVGRDFAAGWHYSPGGENYKDTSGWRTVTLAE